MKALIQLSWIFPDFRSFGTENFGSLYAVNSSCQSEHARVVIKFNRAYADHVVINCRERRGRGEDKEKNFLTVIRGHKSSLKSIFTGHAKII